MTLKDLPEIQISKDERIWLLECWNHLKNHDNIDSYKHIKLRTLELVSKDFEPWKIDEKLVRKKVEITILGLIALGVEKEVFLAANKVFSFIRKELIKDVDKNVFDINHVADCLKEDRKFLRISYNLFYKENLNLYNSAGSNSGGGQFGYESLTIEDSAFNTYMNNNSIEEIFLAKQKEIIQYQNQLINQEVMVDLYDTHQRNIDVSDSLFPLEIIANTRGYIETIGRQAWGCYKSGYYDASLIMIRKLIETLIIECYENNNIEEKIKDHDGNFYFLGDLIGAYLKEPKWSIGRNTKSSLPKIKKLGDLSAHNRRFSTKKTDFDKIADDLRIVLEELIHLNGYKG